MTSATSTLEVWPAHDRTGTRGDRTTGPRRHGSLPPAGIRDSAVRSPAEDPELLAVRERILRVLRRRPGRTVPDAVLRDAGWGAAGPDLGEYPRLMAELAASITTSGTDRLERVWESGWILRTVPR